MLRVLVGRLSYAKVMAPCVGVLVAAAIIGVGVESAAGHEARFDSSVSIHFYDHQAPNPGPNRCGDLSNIDCFYGRVTSPLSRCERGRTVEVFRQLDAPPPGKRVFTESIGTVESDQDGRWILGVNDPGSADYYARVHRQVIEREGHVHVCKSAVSRLLPVADFG
jgi:hypothetical protein